MPIGTSHGPLFAGGASYVPPGAPTDPNAGGLTTLAGGPVLPGLRTQLIAFDHLELTMTGASGPDVWGSLNPSDPVPTDELWKVTRLTISASIMPWIAALTAGAVFVMDADPAGIRPSWLVGALGGSVNGMLPQAWYLGPGRCLRGAATGATDPGPPPGGGVVGLQFERYQLVRA